MGWGHIQIKPHLINHDQVVGVNGLLLERKGRPLPGIALERNDPGATGWYPRRERPGGRQLA